MHPIDNQIDFAIRFPASHHLTLRNGTVCQPTALLADQMERYFQSVILDGVRVNVALKKLKHDCLIVGGTLSAKKLLAHYRYRWSIESFFRVSRSVAFIWRRRI